MSLKTLKVVAIVQGHLSEDPDEPRLICKFVGGVHVNSLP